MTNTFEESDLAGSEGKQQGAALEVIANRCAAGSCPTIYRRPDSDGGALVVQGFVVAGPAGIDVPEGEALVEIPVELLTEAMRHLS